MWYLSLLFADEKTGAQEKSYIIKVTHIASGGAYDPFFWARGLHLY